ncbi:peptidase A4 family-domain-containing protein [Aspergillus pseudoustus]|uniref:Peptidase A4 family-domain-containing protein n=1 Tax=Aspergillus pseudoustus TaxID=1810923 RepID=A0ABR4J043_9EURO
MRQFCKYLLLLSHFQGPHHVRRHNRISHPLRPLDPASSPSYLILTSIIDTPSAENERKYSANWAGAVLESPPPNATYTYICATITVPTPSPTPADDGVDTMFQAASAWVGIDGATYTSAILQTGISMNVINGVVSIDAWYEWYPDWATYYDDEDFAIQPGDILVASVNVTASNRGICAMENLSTGQSASATAKARRSSATLAGANAEWVVESHPSEGGTVPFVGFGEVAFQGCTAASSRGESVGLANATVYEMVIDDVVVASVEALDDRTMAIQRQGI